MPKYLNHKYGLRIDGVDHTFDSKLEGDRYLVLHQRQKNKEISHLERQPEFLIQEKFKCDGKTIRAIKYIADYMYVEDGGVVVEDAKGMATDVYKMKKKMFLSKYPEIKFIEVSRYKRGFKEAVYNERS